MYDSVANILMLVQFIFCVFTHFPKNVHTFHSVFNIFVEIYFVGNDSGGGGGSSSSQYFFPEKLSPATMLKLREKKK